MNSLEQAAKALMDDLVNDLDSANLAIIAKHLDAFAREQASDSLIKKNFSLMMEADQIKKQIRELLKDKELLDYLEANRSYSDGHGDWNAWAISALRKTVRELIAMVKKEALDKAALAKGRGE
jgi:hypothetical protein